MSSCKYVLSRSSMLIIQKLTVNLVGHHHPTGIEAFHVLRCHHTQRYVFGLVMRLLRSSTSMGRYGICLLGVISITLDTSKSMLEQIGYSTVSSSLSNLLLGYTYNPHCGLHEVHRCFVPSGDCLPSQRQAHLHDLLWLDDRFRQFGVCVADSDQLLLPIYLFDEPMENHTIVANACHR